MRYELTLEWNLSVEESEVVTELIISGDDDTLTTVIVLGTTCPPHHLEDVLLGKFDPLALLRGIYLSALYDDSMGWKIDTPSKGCCRNQHSYVSVSI